MRKAFINPDHYHAKVLGCKSHKARISIGASDTIKRILRNPIYVGTLAQLKTTTVSYKNHKTIFKDPSEWAVIPNHHEAIVSQELWDKVREFDESVSQGKRDKRGETAPLSEFLICDKCGGKMKSQHSGSKAHPQTPSYVCRRYVNYGKLSCTSHYIKRHIIEGLVLADIRSKIALTVDEEGAKQMFLEKKSTSNSVQQFEDRKNRDEYETRIAELDKLILTVYDDKVIGKIPENVCISLLEKYQAEKEKLVAELNEIKERSMTATQDERDVEEFIKRLKKYACRC